MFTLSSLQLDVTPVNMVVVPAKPYHHGQLADALITVAVGLAEESGPGGVVLREAARRVGVSATAAYRHFDDHGDLLAAVAARAMDELAASMQSLPDERHPRDRRRRAMAAWRATGMGYVRFALNHPGLFRTAFTSPASPRLKPSVTSPYGLLAAALDDCVATGALPASRRPDAEALSWVGVHGLATLALDGLLPSSGPDLDRLLAATLDMTAIGLGCDPSLLKSGTHPFARG